MKGLSVIIADDDLANRRLIGEALMTAPRPMDVLPVRTLPEFSDAIQLQRFDCAVLDYYLTDCTGADLFALLQEHDPDCPVVFLTNCDELSVAVDCLRAGAADFVSKQNAIVSGELYRCVRNAIANRRKAQRRRQIAERRVESFRKLAEEDPLTRLKNRRAIDSGPGKDRRTGRERRELQPVIMIDLDHFKRINDTYGHPVGDRVLKSVADLLRETASPLYDICRWGGEEFLIVCHGADAIAAFRSAEKLRQKIAELRIPAPAPANQCDGAARDAEISITASFGVAANQPGIPPAANFETLIERADKALYLAKDLGRNRTISWSVARLHTEITAAPPPVDRSRFRTTRAMPAIHQLPTVHQH